MRPPPTTRIGTFTSSSSSSNNNSNSKGGEAWPEAVAGTIASSSSLRPLLPPRPQLTIGRLCRPSAASAALAFSRRTPPQPSPPLLAAALPWWKERWRE